MIKTISQAKREVNLILNEKVMKPRIYSFDEVKLLIIVAYHMDRKVDKNDNKPNSR